MQVRLCFRKRQTETQITVNRGLGEIERERGGERQRGGGGK